VPGEPEGRGRPAPCAAGDADAAPALAPAPDADAVPAPAPARAGVVDGCLPAFHRRLRDELTFPLAWGRSRIADFDAWRRAARATVEAHLLAPADDPGEIPYDPEFADRAPAVLDGRAYRRETVTFTLTRYARVRAALLTPAGDGPFPAVLLLHDHGATFGIGKEKVVAPWYDGEARLPAARRWVRRCYGGRFVGDELAARGHVVLAVDALGWGDRGPLAYAGQQALASAVFHLGSSLAGLTAREDVRAAGFLASLARVDARRVAALGFSLGGFRAWQLAALSDDVAAAACVCWMTGVQDLTAPGGDALRGQSAYHLLHPGLARHLDFPDVASIACPRPMLFFHGGLDPHFTPAAVRAAYGRLRAVWHAAGAGDRLRTRIWPDHGHAFGVPLQDEVFRWLDACGTAPPLRRNTSST
jgi:dienelactone hydrolase